MSANAVEFEVNWMAVCRSEEIQPNLGVRALIDDEQVALFRIEERLFAVSAVDPFSGAAVLSRGIIGDLKGQIVVASPIFKQHFNLETGQCLEDESVCLKTYQVREVDGQVFVAA